MRTEQEIIKQWKDDDVLVSICCTAYNHEEYIEDALQGFLIQQTNFAFEIIISDDCSTDNTTKIIKEYVKKYPSIIKPILLDENQYSKGALPIRDFILPEVKGKYIALCEGDDYWTDPAKLQQQVDFLEQNTEYIGCGHNTRFLVNGELTDRLFVSQANKKYSYVFEDFIDSAYLHTTSLVFRYDSDHMGQIKQYLGMYSSIKRNDVFMLLVFSKSGPIKYMDKTMSVYRMNDGGIWSGANDEAQLIMFLHGCVDFSYIFGDEYKDKFLYSFANTFSEGLKDSSESFLSDVLKEFSERDYKTVIESFTQIKRQDNATIKDCSEYINFLENQVNDNSFRALIVKFIKVVGIYKFLKKIRGG